MNSSVKFLLPTIIVGLACGVAEATAAVPPKTIATPNEIANAAFAARRVCFLIMGPPRTGIDTPWSLRNRHRSRRGRSPYGRKNQGGQERERRDPERGADAARQAVGRLVDDDVAQPSAACDRGDGRRGDDEDRGDADAGQDERQAERQLDAPENVELGHAHPARGVDDVSVAGVDGEERVREDRRNSEDDERDVVVPETDPEDGQPERDEDEARERPADVRHARSEEEPAMQVAEPEPERQRQNQRDAECGPGELEMLTRLLEEEMRVLAHEPERVRERPHTDLAHGVRARWSSTSAPSATSARATTIPPAAKISVLKTFCSSAMK